ncbi:MAG: helical backbone metal receptor [Anaerolineae bacterium]|nr:helical backbone metal receptor [Anaerolineae bacterium]MDW8173133.1 helical backbone metal receptor [Anaerolineae bacterium]
MKATSPYNDPDVPILSRPPQRVVSLVPSVTESLFDLDLGSRLIGRTDYCIYPAGQVERIPTLGGTKNPDIQRIIELQPDLVILNREENRRQDAEALQAAGISTWATHPRTVQDALNLLWDMMSLFDHPKMVARVRLIEYTFDWVQGVSLAREDEPTKVFVPIWLDPLMTFNADTYIHDLLRVCGGTNVFAHRERLYPLAADLGQKEAWPEDDPRLRGRDVRYPRVTWEEVVAHQPDVILLPSEPYTFSEADLPLFERLDVPAARNGRIHLVDGSLLTWHGTRLAYALEALPKLIHTAE